MVFQRSKKKSGSLIMSQSGVTMEINEETITNSIDESAINEESMTDSTANLIAPAPLPGTGKSFRNIFIVIVMFLINLVNYCDRYTLAG